MSWNYTQINHYLLLMAVKNAVADKEYVSKVGEAIDKVHKLFKPAVTILFPAFHTRNLMSGQGANLLSGLVGVHEIPKYGREAAEAWKMRHNPPQQLLNELDAHQVITRTGAGDVPFLRPTEGIAPESIRNIGESYQQARALAQEPSLIPGFERVPGSETARTIHGTAMLTFSKMHETVEWLNRVPMYTFLRKKGYSAAAAADKVKLLQLDYSALSGFERTFMRRIAPFYSFSRRMSESLFRQLIERPGGPLAQTIRASAAIRDPEGVVPEHVASTLSVPIGLGPRGDKRYISGLGLMHEEPAALIGSGAIPFINRRGMLEAASKLTPIVKGPLEWMTGQSFFQTGPSGGRELEDMDPTLARTVSNVRDLLTGTQTTAVRPLGGPALEHIAANLPTTRIATTLRTAADPRKGIGEKLSNLLSGVRTTTVSEAQEERILSERIDEVMRELGGRRFEKVYVPEDIEAKLTPEEKAALETVKKLKAAIAKRRKERKKRKEQK